MVRASMALMLVRQGRRITRNLIEHAYYCSHVRLRDTALHSVQAATALSILKY